MVCIDIVLLQAIMYLNKYILKGRIIMAYEDREKHYIETLVDQKKWLEAYNCLRAYIDNYGEDYWAKNMKKLIEDNL